MVDNLANGDLFVGSEYEIGIGETCDILFHSELPSFAFVI